MCTGPVLVRLRPPSSFSGCSARRGGPQRVGRPAVRCRPPAGIVEQRCLTGQTGASWQMATVGVRRRRSARPHEALRLMTQRYISRCTPTSPCTRGRWERRPPQERPRSARRVPSHEQIERAGRGT
jgi:hypothetical protein